MKISFPVVAILAVVTMVCLATLGAAYHTAVHAANAHSLVVKISDFGIAGGLVGFVGLLIYGTYCFFLVPVGGSDEDGSDSKS
jgi:uncharacterized membrane protein